MVVVQVDLSESGALLDDSLPVHLHILNVQTQNVIDLTEAIAVTQQLLGSIMSPLLLGMHALAFV